MNQKLAALAEDLPESKFEYRTIGIALGLPGLQPITRPSVDAPRKVLSLSRSGILEVPGFPDPHTGWLVLAMSSTLAGNLTITGSVANIIVVERARPEVHIGFREYFRLGLPLTLITLVWEIVWLSVVR